MTKLLYLEDFTILEQESVVTALASDEAGRDVVLIDQTIFYPQGGGQPYDQGVMETGGAKFIVEEVRFIDGEVKHIGHFEKGKFTVGDKVVCKVDPARRELNSKIHSAGHVVDMAVYNLGLPWVPGKGYHFPNGPYVEYEGQLTDEQKTSLVTTLQAKIDELVERGAPNQLLFMEKDRLHEVCRHVPDYIPEGKPARVVMFGDFGVPCGGTHVKDIKDLRRVVVRKIKKEKDAVRVSYDVER